MRIFYIIIKISIVLNYISTFFKLTEGWIHFVSALLWTPAVFAIIFLKKRKEVKILLVTLGISIFVEPFVLYNLYGVAPFFQALIFVPLVFYILLLYKEDL